VSLLSTIYGGAVRAKNQLYDHGFLSQQRLRAPVVSVGNLSVGGTGKTPFVILLGGALTQQGIKFDVLSRGYGRRSRGPRLVDANGLPEQFGDEPLLIARRVGCPVIVGESRYQAGRFAEEKFSSQLHLLDDGFQHRSLARELNIVLLTAADLRDNLLPSGRLREPLSSLARADEIILMGDFEAPPLSAGKLHRVRRQVAIENPPARPIVFCGIARPGFFLEQLRAQGIHPAAEKFYRDHYRYTSADVSELQRLRDRHGADGFITTEKDAVNLGSRISQLKDAAVVRVSMQFEPPDGLDTLVNLIANLGRPA
jgi:tetraacyldisaccharide 4'-kinase